MNVGLKEGREDYKKKKRKKSKPK